MTHKHTPGPWHHDKRGYPHPDVKAANGRNVACTWGVNNQPKTTAAAKTQMQIARANARLIAAAPELLEAAKLVIAWYEAEDDHSGTDFYERVEMCRESETALRAAIAKATGEQQ